jgi:hypothetical protein
MLKERFYKVPSSMHKSEIVRCQYFAQTMASHHPLSLLGGRLSFERSDTCV